VLMTKWLETSCDKSNQLNYFPDLADIAGHASGQGVEESEASRR